MVDQGFASYLSSLSPDRQHLILRYRLIDAANKVVGVGSVGTSSSVLYFEGIDEGDPLFLQAKEAQNPSLPLISLIPNSQLKAKEWSTDNASSRARQIYSWVMAKQMKKNFM